MARLGQASFNGFFTICANYKIVDSDARMVSGACIHSSDDTVKIWDAESGEMKKDLKGHTDSVCGVAISGDGRWLASARSV